MIVKLSEQEIKRYNWYIWRFFIGCFAFIIILIGLATFGVFGALPSLRDLENPKSDQATIVYSADKQILGNYYKKNRTSVTYKQISPNVLNALVAKEDNHFYSHSGIDFWRTFSIIAYNLIGSRQGASTITQQLARNQFSTEERAHNPIKRFIQKLQELIIAIRIEKHYTKEEIITMYLNTVDFGSNSFGIWSAAHTYFNTTPDKLTPDQAAVLIQTLTSTTRNSPRRNPDKALMGRDFVLKRMVDEHFLSEGQYNEYKAKPLGIDFHPVDPNQGEAPYFRDFLKRQIKKILTSINKPDGTPYDIYRDGLKVYTTINYTMQQYAEEAQKEYMRTLQKEFNEHWNPRWHNYAKEIKNYQLLIDSGMRHCDRYKELKLEGNTDEEIKQNFYTPDNINLFTWHGNIDTLMRPVDSIIYCQFLLRNSLMSMDPTTGYIKAWVGGINFEHFQADQVYRGTRQVGSTAKPFTYAQAIDDGYSPCLLVPNVPDTIYYPGSPPWCPNSGKTETVPGPLTLRQALAHSQNWITAHMIKLTKWLPVAELAQKMGVTSHIPIVPSIAIGSFDASVYDMTGAYSVFVNHGMWTQPTYLLRIEDKNGNVIYTQTAPVKKALSDQTAYVMTYMLKGVIEEGTGKRLRSQYDLNNPIGGKTGTTNDNSDGWFIGITPHLVTGIWTGCENRDIHFRTQSLGEGANSALPIFALYMKKVYANAGLGIKRSDDFTPPKDPLTIELDCSKYTQQQKGTNEVEKKLSF